MAPHNNTRISAWNCYEDLCHSPPESNTNLFSSGMHISRLVQASSRWAFRATIHQQNDKKCRKEFVKSSIKIITKQYFSSFTWIGICYGFYQEILTAWKWVAAKFVPISCLLMMRQGKIALITIYICKGIISKMVLTKSIYEISVLLDFLPFFFYFSLNIIFNAD